MSSNLPPGVTESMLPGNRPEDVWYDIFWDSLELPDFMFEMEPSVAADMVHEILRQAGDIFTAGMNVGRAEMELEMVEKQHGYQ